MEDIYSAFVKRLGTTRKEAKLRAYQSAYSADRPPVDVLGPDEAVPVSVQFPQVVETCEEIDRMGWKMRTRAGQRFFVGFNTAYDSSLPPDGLLPEALLGEALEKGQAIWL